jgi:hypothetical protein
MFAHISIATYKVGTQNSDKASIIDINAIKMNFFMNPTEFVSTNRNLRDVFMQAVKSQGTLVENTEIRFIP